MTRKNLAADAQSAVTMTITQKKNKSELGWHHFFERLAAEKSLETRQDLPRSVQE
ncbi:hypothetical protein LA304_17700 [Celeribacter sp. ASW11-22]|nr:hypothetical protein [Celeribacter litoreus]